MNIEHEPQINGYGAFGSVEEFALAVEARKKAGLPLTGSGEILLGAEFISRWEIKKPHINYPRLKVNVSTRGDLVITSDEPIAGLGPWKTLNPII